MRGGSFVLNHVASDAAKFIVEHSEQARDDARGKGVVDRLRLPLGAHHAGLTQHRQVLREGGLAEGEALVQLTDGQSLGHEMAQDHQPLLIAEGAQHAGRRATVRLHVARRARQSAARAACLSSGYGCRCRASSHLRTSVNHGVINNHLLI